VAVEMRKHGGCSLDFSSIDAVLVSALFLVVLPFLIIQYMIVVLKGAEHPRISLWHSVIYVVSRFIHFVHGLIWSYLELGSV
jgi:hypothetical protein